MADSDTRTLNGHPIDSIDNAANALSYLSKGYNGGDITRTHEGGLIVLSRRQRFQHLHLFLDADAIEVRDIRAVTVDGDARLEVELVEADR